MEESYHHISYVSSACSGDIDRLFIMAVGVKYVTVTAGSYLTGNAVPV